MVERSGRLLVGTSGWIYRHWVPFLPRKLPQRRWLEFLSRVFPTIEINASFYMLPKPETFARWAEQTPQGFLFAVKASRYLTHMKRLRDPEPAVEKLLHAARPLGAKLGPLLLQLPPQFSVDPPRLAAALEAFRAIGRSIKLVPRLAVEFRHRSWLDSSETLAVLRRHRSALVLAHSTRWPSDRAIHGAVGLPAVPRRRSRPLWRLTAPPVGAPNPALASRGPPRLRLLQQRLGRSRPEGRAHAHASRPGRGAARGRRIIVPASRSRVLARSSG
jgi:uncharacterized protein YecE (DUF72 family)